MSYTEARKKAQELVDSLFSGKSVEMDVFGHRVIVPIPKRYEVTHHSPLAVKVDSTVEVTREMAIESIARSSWARGWSEGMLRAFGGPEFEKLPEEEKQKRISEWARKLATRVVSV